MEKLGHLQDDPWEIIPLLPDGGERTEEAPELQPDILMATTAVLVLCRGNTHTQSVLRLPKRDEGIDISKTVERLKSFRSASPTVLHFNLTLILLCLSRRGRLCNVQPIFLISMLSAAEVHHVKAHIHYRAHMTLIKGFSLSAVLGKAKFPTFVLSLYGSGDSCMIHPLGHCHAS